MKKIISIIAAAVFTGTAIAADLYDEVQMVPATLQPGTVGTLSIRFDCPSAKDMVKYLQFTVEYPEGWTIGKADLCQERVSDYDPEFEEYGDAKMSLNTTTDGTKRKYVIYSNTIKDAMNGDTGNILTLKIKVPADAQDGYYPINILSENSYYCIDSDAAHNIVLGASTSYVKVGTPEGKTLTMTGSIPSFVNEALAQESGITKLDLTGVTASNGVFVYRVGREVVAPTVEVLSKLKAVADVPVSPNLFSSIRLPFAANISCYTLGEIKDGYIMLDAATQLAEGTSAIIDRAVESNVVEDVIRGAEKQVIETGAYLKSDRFFYVNGNATIPALRGFWELPAGVKGFYIEDDETGIHNLDGVVDESPIYNVAGVLLPKAQRGINIIETKKIIKK